MARPLREELFFAASLGKLDQITRLCLRITNEQGFLIALLILSSYTLIGSVFSTVWGTTKNYIFFLKGSICLVDFFTSYNLAYIENMNA